MLWLIVATTSYIPRVRGSWLTLTRIATPSVGSLLNLMKKPSKPSPAKESNSYLKNLTQSLGIPKFKPLVHEPKSDEKGKKKA